jgi:hypothetical protein
MASSARGPDVPVVFLKSSSSNRENNPSPTASVDPRKSVASMAPNSAHMIMMIQAAPNPCAKSSAEGHLTGEWVSVATMKLLTAPLANKASTNANCITASANSFPDSTLSRSARCISRVLNVPHPYSLPVTSAPKINAIAPPKMGKPAITPGISCAGSIPVSSAWRDVAETVLVGAAYLMNGLM